MYFKNIRYSGVYFFLIIFLILGCEKDTPSEESINENLTIKKIKYENIPDLSKIFNRANINQRTSSDSIENDILKFNIIKEDVIVVENNQNTWYTLQIKRSRFNSNFFENLVIHKKKNGKTKAYLIKYFPDSNYIDRLKSNTDTYFSGTQLFKKIDFDSENISSRTNGQECILVTYSYCSWGGSNAAVGDACYNNPDGGEHIQSSTTYICYSPGSPYLSDNADDGIAFNSGPTGGSGGSGVTGSQNDTPQDELTEVDVINGNSLPTDEFLIDLDLESLNRECENLNNLINSSSFENIFQELLNATIGNTEIGYVGFPSDNGNTNFPIEHRVEGQEGIAGINFQFPPNAQMTSFIHNHFNPGNGALPIFSGADLYSLYQLYLRDNLVTREFVYLVVTPGNSISSNLDDTLYAITINNTDDFEEFGNLFLRYTETADVLYSNSIAPINENISSELNELRFVNMLEDQDSGLTVYRGNTRNLGQWTRLRARSDNSIRERNCD